MIHHLSLNKKTDAVIALTTLLVVTAILLFGGITILLTSIDITRTTDSSSNIVLGRLRSRSCLEEAMYHIRADANYTGTITINYLDGSCEAQVTNATASTKNINVKGIIDEFTYEELRVADITLEPIQLID